MTTSGGSLPLVLLVDRDDARRAQREELMAGAGYAVRAMADADAALSEGLEGVDAVVVVAPMNAGSPALVSGLRDALGTGEFVPIVVIGDDDPQERVRSFEAGCDDVAPSGVSFVELDARIRSLLRHRKNQLELAAANRQLRDADDKKKALAALVVHDLRSPLTALQGNVELLYEELAADTRVAGILADAQELCRKAIGMVADILDVAELEDGLLVASPGPLDVGKLLRTVASHYRVPLHTRKLEVVVECEDELELELDRGLVSRVVENLLNNSVRYAPIGGRIVLAASREGGGALLRVGNNGPAVPEDERERIFERYYRIDARRAGARANRGLGLYFCMLVALAHGGTIAVESLPGLPACFTLRVPQPPQV